MSNIRRAIAMFAALAALVLATGSPVAAYGDAKGPPCSDYIVGDLGGFGYFLDENDHGIVAGRNQLSKPACSKVDYKAVILSADGLSTIGTAIGSANTFVGGQPVVEFMFDVGLTPPAAVCVYMTSSKSDKKVIDRAPDTGCEVIVIGTSPAGRGQG